MTRMVTGRASFIGMAIFIGLVGGWGALAAFLLGAWMVGISMEIETW